MLHCKRCCKTDTAVCPVRCVLGSQPQFNTHQPFTHCQILTRTQILRFIRTHECIRDYSYSPPNTCSHLRSTDVSIPSHPLISSRTNHEKDDPEKSESKQSRTPVGRFSVGVNRILVLIPPHHFACPTTHGNLANRNLTRRVPDGEALIKATGMVCSHASEWRRPEDLYTGTGVRCGEANSDSTRRS